MDIGGQFLGSRFVMCFMGLDAVSLNIDLAGFQCCACGIMVFEFPILQRDAGPKERTFQKISGETCKFSGFFVGIGEGVVPVQISHSDGLLLPQIFLLRRSQKNGLIQFAVVVFGDQLGFEFRLVELQIRDRTVQFPKQSIVALPGNVIDGLGSKAADQTLSFFDLHEGMYHSIHFARIECGVQKLSGVIELDVRLIDTVSGKIAEEFLLTNIGLDHAEGDLLHGIKILVGNGAIRVGGNDTIGVAAGKICVVIHLCPLLGILGAANKIYLVCAELGKGIVPTVALYIFDVPAGILGQLCHIICIHAAVTAVFAQDMVAIHGEKGYLHSAAIYSIGKAGAEHGDDAEDENEAFRERFQTFRFHISELRVDSGRCDQFPDFAAAMLS